MMNFKEYKSSQVLIRAFRFDGFEHNVPDWCSVKGTKLPPEKREVEFYASHSDSYERASYGDWIILTQDLHRLWLPDVIFQSLFTDKI